MLMPSLAFGECVWQASPKRKTLQPIGEGLDDTLGDGVPAHPLDVHDGHSVGIEDVWDAVLENAEDSGAVLA